MKRKTTIWTTLQAVVTLQKLALSLGFVQDRGPAKGQGSISAMIEALAQGQLTITKRNEIIITLSKKEYNFLTELLDTKLMLDNPVVVESIKSKLHQKESEHEQPDNQTPARIRKEISSDY